MPAAYPARSPSMKIPERKQKLNSPTTRLRLCRLHPDDITEKVMFGARIFTSRETFRVSAAPGTSWNCAPCSHSAPSAILGWERATTVPFYCSSFTYLRTLSIARQIRITVHAKPTNVGQEICLDLAASDNMMEAME